MIVAARHPALAVVNFAGAVDRDAERAEPCLLRGANALLGQRSRATLDAAMDAGVRDRLDDDEPILAQIGFAADQRDLPRAEFGELAHDVEAFVSGELIGALV